MKTARFSDLIKQAGKPSTHLLLVEPKKDSALIRAAKENRVLSVQREIRGARKDSGQVGIFQAEHTQFLVFPHSIGKYSGRKIVGIDFDQVQEPKSGPAPVAKAIKPAQGPEIQVADEEEGEEEEKNTPAGSVVTQKNPKGSRKKDGGRRTARGSAPASGSPVAGKPSKLETAIRKAMKELEANNAVAAYKTLQGAID